MPGPVGLRELLAADDVVAAAGCYDAFSARVAAAAGFEAVYMTGNGASAVRLGSPDVGLMTLTEMADQAGRMAAAVDVPLIADADTGFGGPLSVIRTVETYGRAGVAALHLEDQAMPKRCGHLAGKQLIGAAEHAGRIRAAVDARGAEGPLVIGRTDAVSVEGVESAIDRAISYGEAGADLLFVEGLPDVESISRAVEVLGDWPLVYAWVEGKGPQLTVSQLGELGIRVVIFPLTAILSTLANLGNLYAALRRDGSPASMMDAMATFEEFNEFMGTVAASDRESRYT